MTLIGAVVPAASATTWLLVIDVALVVEDEAGAGRAAVGCPSFRRGRICTVLGSTFWATAATLPLSAASGAAPLSVPITGIWPVPPTHRAGDRHAADDAAEQTDDERDAGDDRPAQPAAASRSPRRGLRRGGVGVGRLGLRRVGRGGLLAAVG